MAETVEIKIPITTPGASQAKSEVEALASGFQHLEQSQGRAATGSKAVGNALGEVSGQTRSASKEVQAYGTKTAETMEISKGEWKKLSREVGHSIMPEMGMAMRTMLGPMAAVGVGIGLLGKAFESFSESVKKDVEGPIDSVKKLSEATSELKQKLGDAKKKSEADAAEDLKKRGGLLSVYAGKGLSGADDMARRFGINKDEIMKAQIESAGALPADIERAMAAGSTLEKTGRGKFGDMFKKAMEYQTEQGDASRGFSPAEFAARVHLRGPAHNPEDIAKAAEIYSQEQGGMKGFDPGMSSAILDRQKNRDRFVNAELAKQEASVKYETDKNGNIIGGKNTYWAQRFMASGGAEEEAKKIREEQDRQKNSAIAQAYEKSKNAEISVESEKDANIARRAPSGINAQLGKIVLDEKVPGASEALGKLKKLGDQLAAARRASAAVVAEAARQRTGDPFGRGESARFESVQEARSNEKTAQNEYFRMADAIKATTGYAPYQLRRYESTGSFSPSKEEEKNGRGREPSDMPRSIFPVGAGNDRYVYELLLEIARSNKGLLDNAKKNSSPPPSEP